MSRDTRKSPHWSEKYRPRKIADCVLPGNLKALFSQIVIDGVVPNMLLTGTSGVGKTTVAMALADELKMEWHLINASEKGGIDTLRTEVRDFASTKSFNNKRKVIILDEADYLNPLSTQPALRGFTDEFAINTSFILTANIQNKIIPYLHSRLSIIEFGIPKTEKEGLVRQFLKRLKYILDTEGVTYDMKTVAAFALKMWPDLRRCINELQTQAKKGRIDGTILEQVRDVPITELIEILKANDYKSMRAWCATHGTDDAIRTLRKMYDALYEYWDSECIPDIVLLIGKYQYQAAFAQDQELNMAAFFTEVMYVSKFKKS